MAQAQFGIGGNTITTGASGAPTGPCSVPRFYVDQATGDLYDCLAGAWHKIASGGSSPLTTKGDLFGFSTVNARVPVGSDGSCLKADSSNALGVSYSACAGAATGYQTIQNAASAITQRTILNWTAGIVCVDNAGATRSDCALSNISATSHKFFNAVISGALSSSEPASTDLADFSTTAPTTAGKIPIYDPTAPNAAGGTGAYVPGDPLVQGTQAAASTTIPNPVVDGGSDYGGTPAVRVLKVDSSGNIYVANFPSSFSVGNFPATQTVNQATGSNLHVVVDTAPTTAVTQNTSPWVVSCTASNCTVKAADSGGNVVTTNSSTFTAKFAWDTNLLGTLGTTFSTPGKVDVKGADGDIFVRQTTGSNLHVVVDTAPTTAVTQSTNPWVDAGNKTDNNAAPSTDNLASLQGIARTDYRGGTAATAGRLMYPDISTDGATAVNVRPAMRPASYRASAQWSPVATTATDILRMPGNASNTVLVTQVMFSCTATTAGVQKISLIKRSTAGSGGTSANMTVVPMDSNYAAGASVPVTYTANPTVGTIIGDVDDLWMGVMATGTASPNDIYVGNFRSKPIVLRGTAENLVINLNSVSIAGIACAASIEWQEITTITP